MVSGQEINQTQRLIESGEFQKAYELISEYLDAGNHVNIAYVLKAKALEGLGRIEEAETFFWHKINWKNPTTTDLDMVKLLEKISESKKWKLATNRLNYIYNLMSSSPISEMNTFDQLHLEYNLNALDNDDYSEPVFLSLAWHYFAQNDIVKSAFYHMAYSFFHPDSPGINQLESGVSISYFINISDIYMYLLGEDNDTFAFVVEREEDLYHYTLMAKVLKKMKKNPIVLLPPVPIEVKDKDFDLNLYIKKSFDDSQTIDNIKFYTPIDIVMDESILERTTYALLNELAKKHNNHLPLFAERITLDYLNSSSLSRKELHYVCNSFEFKGAKNSTCFAYIRGYEKYISKLYKLNAEEELNAKPKYKFSIVLPVRNNANTIRYTLKTCIEQSFDDYEIVVTDNSDEGDESTYNVIKELNSDKIKYYKTPRKLPISKSFEYAFLKARGEFLIPIGADDAVLYNGLSDINKVLKEYPNNDILLWDRLHYVWPNFICSNQSDEFIIPRSYIPNKVETCIINCQEALKDVVNFKYWIYEMPLLYINSGMKKSYLLKMLEKTGAMIDGLSQDLYTGVANLAINKEILHLKYPITIAALSSNSTGAISMVGQTNIDTVKKREHEILSTNIGIHEYRNLENIVPLSDGDVSNMITSVLRLIDMGCISYDMLSEIDWKEAFKQIVEQLQMSDVNLETRLFRLIEASKILSDELYEWFIDQINSNKFILLIHRNNAEKNYYKGMDIKNGLHLDASDFGVQNVYDASVLFKKLYNI